MSDYIWNILFWILMASILFSVFIGLIAGYVVWISYFITRHTPKGDDDYPTDIFEKGL